MYWSRLNSVVIIGLLCSFTSSTVLAVEGMICNYSSVKDGSWSSPSTWGNVSPDCEPQKPGDCACTPRSSQRDIVEIHSNVTGGAVGGFSVDVFPGANLNVKTVIGAIDGFSIGGTMDVEFGMISNGVIVRPGGLLSVGETLNASDLLVGNPPVNCCKNGHLPDEGVATAFVTRFTGNSITVGTGATARVCFPTVGRVDVCGGTFKTSTSAIIGTLAMCGETARVATDCSSGPTPIQPLVVEVFGGATLTIPGDRVQPSAHLNLGRISDNPLVEITEFFTNGTLQLDGDMTNPEFSTIRVLEGSRIVPYSLSKTDAPVLLNEGILQFEQFNCDGCEDGSFTPSADLEVRVTNTGVFEAKTGVVRIARTLTQPRGGDIRLGDSGQNLIGGDIRLDGDEVSILSENGSITGFGTIRSFNEDKDFPDRFQFVDFQGRKGTIHAVQLPSGPFGMQGDKLFFDVPVIHAQNITLRHFLNNEVVFSEFHFLKGFSYVYDVEIECADTFEISPFFIETIFDYVGSDSALIPQQVTVAGARCEPCGVLSFMLSSSPDLWVIGMRKFRNNPPCVVDLDCDGDGVPPGSEPDADGNQIPDDCDADSDGDGLPDGAESNADGDNIPDDTEIGSGLSEDCNLNGLPDHVETDCDGDGVIDDCETDSDGNGIPDDCEIDCNGDGIPNEEEPDCDGNGLPDDCEVDIDDDGIPDACDNCRLVFNPLQDVEPNDDGFLNGQLCEPRCVPTDNPELLTVLSPLPGETFMAGESIDLAWESDLPGLVCLSLHRDCGAVVGLTCNPIADGSATVTLCPELRADDGYRIRLQHVNSPRPLSINVTPTFSISGAGSGDLPVIVMTGPDENSEVKIGSTVQFTWDHFHASGQLQFSVFRRVGPGFEFAANLGPVDMTDGTVAWPIAADLEPGTYAVFVRDLSNCGVSADVDPLILIAANDPSGDIDGDGDTDLGDFDLLTDCVGMDPSVGGTCATADIDGSGAVDVLDFARFQAMFTGPM